MTFVPMTTTGLRAMACACGPRAGGYARAAGGADDLAALTSTLCGLPGYREAARLGRDVLRTGSVQQVTSWVVDGYADVRSIIPLLPYVSRRQVEAIWTALDAALRLCDARAGGWQQPVLRSLATAIDIVGSPVAAVPLYAAATAVGSSGLLIEVVGVAVTGWIGGAMAAVVGLCEALKAMGFAERLRQIAYDIDREEQAATQPVSSVWDDYAWTGPTKPGATTTTTPGEGGAAVAAVGGLAGVFLLLKLLR